MENKIKLSVSMITLNEEKKLEKTLKSVAGLCDEIIIIDSGSTDKTIEIAKKYGAKVYFEEWKGFGNQKNSALEKCSGEWILLLDADEELSHELVQEIQSIITERQTGVFEIPRISYCFGRKTRHKDYEVRLVSRKTGKYNDKHVHEDFITTEKKEKLRNVIKHHTYIDHEEYFAKFNRYTTLSAMDMKKKGKKVSISYALVNSVFKFIKKYFFKLGFLDGADGLVLSLYSAFYNFVKYVKLWELYNKENKK